MAPAFESHHSAQTAICKLNGSRTHLKAMPTGLAARNCARADAFHTHSTHKTQRAGLCHSNSASRMAIAMLQRAALLSRSSKVQLMMRSSGKTFHALSMLTHALRPAMRSCYVRLWRDRCFTRAPGAAAGLAPCAQASTTQSGWGLQPTTAMPTCCLPASSYQHTTKLH